MIKIAVFKIEDERLKGTLVDTRDGSERFLGFDEPKGAILEASSEADVLDYLVAQGVIAPQEQEV